MLTAETTRPSIAAVEDRIHTYYRLVDAGDIGAIVDLFTSEATYHRPGYPPLHGTADLRRFYGSERVIDHGTHAVSTILTAGSQAAVHGTFDGVLHDGSRVSLRFADFFCLNDELLFARRDTFFFAPLV